MQIKAKAKLYWEEYRGYYKLELHVKFKLPNQKFNRTSEKLLASSWLVGSKYKDINDFWISVYEALNDKERLENEVKSVIIQYIKEKYKLTATDKNIAKVTSLIEAINKDFIVEFEYKDLK